MEKKRRYKKRAIENTQSKESSSPYLVIDNSFEDQENANRQHWINLTPEQRLAEATRMIRMILIERGNQKIKKNRLIIDSYE